MLSTIPCLIAKDNKLKKKKKKKKIEEEEAASVQVDHIMRAMHQSS
jgi:hypothetical protein